MDHTARRRLVTKVTEMLEEGNTLPLVLIDDFFEGNTDQQSIGVNLLPDQHIGLAGFRRVLESVRSKPEVKSVYLELTEIPILDDPGDDEIWPTACAAFVITQASLEDVRQWVAPLHPRDVCLGWCVKEGVAVPVAEADLQPGLRIVRAWLL
jgi:hypothetical protein